MRRHVRATSRRGAWRTGTRRTGSTDGWLGGGRSLDDPPKQALMGDGEHAPIHHMTAGPLARSQPPATWRPHDAGHAAPGVTPAPPALSTQTQPQPQTQTQPLTQTRRRAHETRHPGQPPRRPGAHGGYTSRGRSRTGAWAGSLDPIPTPTSSYIHRRPPPPPPPRHRQSASPGPQPAPAPAPWSPLARSVPVPVPGPGGCPNPSAPPPLLAARSPPRPEAPIDGSWPVPHRRRSGRYTPRRRGRGAWVGRRVRLPTAPRRSGRYLSPPLASPASGCR